MVVARQPRYGFNRGLTGFFRDLHADFPGLVELVNLPLTLRDSSLRVQARALSAGAAPLASDARISLIAGSPMMRFICKTLLTNSPNRVNTHCM